MLTRSSWLAVLLAAGLMLMSDWAGAKGKTDDASPVENTARNARDKGGATLTPEDQLQNEGDLRITADVRKAITGDDSLSINAHNAKVITRNGTVTLRGPVNSEAEKNRLQDIAQKTPGVNQVDNQLDVQAP
jgi:hyperosmotically inducible protein